MCLAPRHPFVSLKEYIFQWLRKIRSALHMDLLSFSTNHMNAIRTSIDGHMDKCLNGSVNKRMNQNPKILLCCLYLN